MSKLYTLVKNFWLSCAHSLPGAGKCERIHGHNYKVTFAIRGNRLDEKQMLIDFRLIKHELMNRFDHRLLNDEPEFNPDKGGILPSTEAIAEVFYNIIAQLCAAQSNSPSLLWVEIEENNEVYARFELI